MQLTKNALYLFSARFINALSIMALTLIISRMLGPDIFGGYSFLNAVVMTGIVVANFGLDTLMVREVSRDHSLGNKYLVSVLGFKVISSLVVMVGLFSFFMIFLPGQAMIRLLAVFSTVIFLNSLSQSFWYYGDAFQKFRFHAGLWAFSNMMKLPMVWFFISFTKNLSMVIYALVIAELISLIISGLCIRIYFEVILNSFSIKFVSPLFKEAWPLAIVFILSVLYFRVDLLMLEIIKGDKAVGIYSAAYKLIEFLSIIPGTICVAALPGLATDYSVNIDDFRASSFKTLALLGGAGAVIGFIFYVFSEKIILFLYGFLFFDSIFSLRILSWVVFFLFLNGYLAYITIATNNEKAVALILLLSTLLNVLFNYFLIPKYGPVGAALSTLFSEILMLFFYGFLLLKKNIFLKPEMPLTPVKF
ncbi:flippase [Thermodesulfobacteriota bacterium]